MNKLVDLAIMPIRRALRQEIGRLIERDSQIRWAIARCARSVTKDYLAELAEAADNQAALADSPIAYEPDVPADHLEQSRLTEPGPITCEDMGHDPRVHSPSGRAEIAREQEGYAS